MKYTSKIDPLLFCALCEKHGFVKMPLKRRDYEMHLYERFEKMEIQQVQVIADCDEILWREALEFHGYQPFDIEEIAPDLTIEDSLDVIDRYVWNRKLVAFLVAFIRQKIKGKI